MDKTAMLREIGENVRILRESRGYSVTELADRSGVHRNSIYAIERGRKNMTLGILADLAMTLKVNIGDLINDKQNQL